MSRNRALVMVEVEKRAEKEHPRNDLAAQGIGVLPRGWEAPHGLSVDHDHTGILNSVTFHQLHCRHPSACLTGTTATPLSLDALL